LESSATTQCLSHHPARRRAKEGSTVVSTVKDTGAAFVKIVTFLPLTPRILFPTLSSCRFCYGNELAEYGVIVGVVRHGKGRGVVPKRAAKSL
jgi:hypothetical protein